MTVVGQGTQEVTVFVPGTRRFVAALQERETIARAAYVKRVQDGKPSEEGMAPGHAGGHRAWMVSL